MNRTDIIISLAALSALLKTMNEEGRDSATHDETKSILAPMLSADKRLDEAIARREAEERQAGDGS
jgi:hypothetical protein